MNQEDYLVRRVDDQISWYDAKGQSAKRMFSRLRFTEIVMAASIPFVAGFEASIPYSRVIVGVTGVVIAAISGLLSLYRFQENWVEYRISCESLKHEKFLFLTGTVPYDTSDAFTRFVQRVESLISKEHSQWAQSVRAAKEQESVE